jgi:uncharacterized protein
MMIDVDQARALYSGGDTAHDFEHVLRVLRMAEKLARAEGADLKVVRAAALLHDIARAEEDNGVEKIDHAEMSARRAHALLLERGADPDFAVRVSEAIRAHRFRGDLIPATLEGRILFDADKLDAIGAIGVARAFAVAGANNQLLYGGNDHPEKATREQHNSAHTPVAEFNVKLSRLLDRLYTPTARRIGAERHRFMVEFFDRFSEEIAGSR